MPLLTYEELFDDKGGIVRSPGGWIHWLWRAERARRLHPAEYAEQLLSEFRFTEEGRKGQNVAFRLVDS